MKVPTIRTNVSHPTLLLLQLLACCLCWLPPWMVLVAAYDINCIYPENMPDPLTARYQVIEAITLTTMTQRVETPIVLHHAKLYGLCGVNCLAYHDDKVLNALTKRRPLIFTPSFGHNSFSRVMCAIQCYSLFYHVLGEPTFLKELYFDKWGLNVTGLDPGMVSAVETGNILEVVRIVQESDYHPLKVGMLVALEIGSETVWGNKDGWNALGTVRYDLETNSVVNCTANCMVYSDTTGYYPRNLPRKRSIDEDKYAVNGTDMYWQPLLEDDGAGFFSRQEHVTPHIGFTVEPQLRPLGESPPPNYNFTEETLLVIEELRQTASSAVRKTKIRFYDNKLLVRGLLQTGMRKQFSAEHTYEDQLLYIYGLDLSDYDAILNSWKEKIRYDLVRPTTVIQRWGSDMIYTYNGDSNSDSPAWIAARDFQASVRIMPHSEYPSASGCICSAHAEFTTAYTNGYNRSDLTNLQFGGPDGWSSNCDGFLPGARMIGCKENENFTVPDMETLKNECGESRLWGGTHFRESVYASYALCDGLGTLAWAVVDKVRNGSNFTSSYIEGDPLPGPNAPGAMCGPSSTVSPETEPPTGNNTNAAAPPPSPTAMPTTITSNETSSSIKSVDSDSPEDQNIVGDANEQASDAIRSRAGLVMFLALISIVATRLV